jgi:HEAT repeat protein
MPRFVPTALIVAVVLSCGGMTARAPADDEVTPGMQLGNERVGIDTEFAMYHDPDFNAPAPVKRLEDRLLPLWRTVLLRSEADYQRQAAEAIAFSAESGFPGMEAAREDLLTLLETADHPAARVAAARALIAIDDRASADALFEASQEHDSQLRLLVEPALANWEYAPIRDIWRERVRDGHTNRRELVLALDGLAAVGDSEVLDAILAIVLSGDRAGDVRLAAARAAGVADTDTGREEAVEQLLGQGVPGVVQRLCAVALLARHDSDFAREQLLALARDAEPAVVEQALGRLNAIDSNLVLPLAGEAMQNPDPKVRRRAADAYVALPTSERIAALSLLMNDIHPDVRVSVRKDLLQLASQPSMDEAVRASAVDVLGGDNWRGQEQAALLLGNLDHEPAAARLFELMRSDRAEVMVATGWALKMLAIPEMLPDMLAHAEFQTAERLAKPSRPGLDEQVAHLIEAFAVMRFQPADDLLRRHVPKDHRYGYFSRGAAMWGLGYLHEGEPDEGLAAQFVERMNDTTDIVNPEVDIAWRMSATALGRMRAESQLDALRARLAHTYEHDAVAYAIRWSILQITGEVIPTPPPEVRGMSGWFLEPLIEESPADPSATPAGI